MYMPDVQMQNGILRGEKISKSIEYIINKFAEEKLNCAEARQVLKMAEEVLDECCDVQKIGESNEKSNRET